MNTSTAAFENSFLQNSTWKKAFVFTPAVTINIPSLFLCYFNPIGYSVREHTELRASFILKFASLFILFCLSKVKIDSVWLEMLFCYQIWPTVRKNCSGDQEKLLKFVVGCREFARICKKFQIARTIYSHSERSEQFLVTEYFFNLFLEVYHM